MVGHASPTPTKQTFDLRRMKGKSIIIVIVISYYGLGSNIAQDIVHG